MIFGFFTVFAFLSVYLISNASVVLQLVGSWFTFKKMGMPGWKGLIPFYSTYILFEKLWNTKQFWRMIIYLAVYIGAFLFGYLFFALGGVLTVNGSEVIGIVLIILGIASIIGSIVMLVFGLIIEFQLYKRMAHAFALKDAWAWGLLFLSFVFLPIIGFHKNINYYGPVNQV